MENELLFLTMIIINTFYFVSIYKNDKENKKSELKQSIIEGIALDDSELILVLSNLFNKEYIFNF